MDKLITKLAGALVANNIQGDDFVDRLHYHISSAAFLVLAAGTGYQLYGGEPVHCQQPSSGSSTVSRNSNEDGINSYCLARELHRPDVTDDGAQYGDRAGHVMDFGTAFYKWAPLVFVFQAFMFKLPNMLWRYASTNSTKDLQAIRSLVEEARALQDDRDKRRKMDEVVTYFETWVIAYRTYSGKHAKCVGNLMSLFFCCGKYYGSFLSSLYISIKFLNLLVVFLCAGLLIGFFDGDYWKYGLSAVEKIYLNGDWEDPYNFPKMLICNFVVVSSNSDPNMSKSSPSSSPSLEISGASSSSTFAIISPNGVHTVEKVQCVMSINFFLEKAFLLEWFWLVILVCLTLCDIVTWVGKIKQPFSSYFFLRDYMGTAQSLSDAENGAVARGQGEDASSPQADSLRQSFVESYLRSDGVLLLRLLELNTGRSIVGELVAALWVRYQKIESCKAAVLGRDLQDRSGLETVITDENNNLKEPAGLPQLTLDQGHPGDLSESDDKPHRTPMTSVLSSAPSRLMRKLFARIPKSKTGEDKSGTSRDPGNLSGQDDLDISPHSPVDSLGDAVSYDPQVSGIPSDQQKSQGNGSSLGDLSDLAQTISTAPFSSDLLGEPEDLVKKLPSKLEPAIPRDGTGSPSDRGDSSEKQGHRAYGLVLPYSPLTSGSPEYRLKNLASEKVSALPALSTLSGGPAQLAQKFPEESLKSVESEKVSAAPLSNSLSGGPGQLLKKFPGGLESGKDKGGDVASCGKQNQLDDDAVPSESPAAKLKSRGLDKMPTAALPRVSSGGPTELLEKLPVDGLESIVSGKWPASSESTDDTPESDKMAKKHFNPVKSKDWDEESRSSDDTSTLRGSEQDDDGDSSTLRGSEQDDDGDSSTLRGSEQDDDGDSSTLRGSEQDDDGDSSTLRGSEQDDDEDSSTLRGSEQDDDGDSSTLRGSEQDDDGDSSTLRGSEQDDDEDSSSLENFDIDRFTDSFC